MSKKKKKEKRKTDNVRPCWQRRVVGTGAERAGELSDGGGHGDGGGDDSGEDTSSRVEVTVFSETMETTWG